MVQSVEISDMFSKTTVAEKVTQIEKSSPEIAQRQFALHLADRTIERQQKAVPTPKTDEAIIHRDQGKKQDGGQNKKKKEQSEPRKDLQMSIDLKV